MRIAAEGGKNAAMPARKNTAETVRALIEETVASLGYDLWDVTYEKEGRDYNLVVSIDRASGVSIDDCKVVSDAIEPLLDEADPIEGPYCLEVSSAGVSRLLRTDAHLQYAAERGLPVTASAYTPVFFGPGSTPAASSPSTRRPSASRTVRPSSGRPSPVLRRNAENNYE